MCTPGVTRVPHNGQPGSRSRPRAEAFRSLRRVKQAKLRFPAWPKTSGTAIALYPLPHHGNTKGTHVMCQNLYCSQCLRTQAFLAVREGFRCPACRKILMISDPPRTRVQIRQRKLARAEAVT